MANITVEQLTSVAPYGNKAIIANTVTAINEYAEEFGLDSNLRLAHFIAQIAHESAGFRTTVEYSGNTRRYAPWYGRGLIQTTWKENYAQFYEWAVARNLNPPEFYTDKGRDQVARFPWAFLCSVWYWETRKLNRHADNDDIRAITKLINGGYNGLADRIEYLNKAKRFLKVKANVVDVAPGKVAGVKRKVIEVQNALIAKGFDIVADGKSGPMTVAAVKMFQKMNDLVPDGVIGPKTDALLFG